MAFPKRWRCPRCNKVIKNRRYCYFCGYGRESGNSQRATRKEKPKKIKKIPIIVSITLLALVLSLTFWNKIKAFKPLNKEKWNELLLILS